MRDWQPKKQYNNNLIGYETIIYYRKDNKQNKNIIKGKIKSIFERCIVIYIEEININCLDHYIYDNKLTVCFNLIDKIMVKDPEIDIIKENFHKNNDNLCIDISNLIINFIDGYIEI